MGATINKPTKEELTAAFAAALGGNDDVAYYVKNTDTAAILNCGGIFAVEKERIKTSFWFGYGYCACRTEDEAESARTAAQSSMEYFRAASMKNCRGLLEEAKTADYMYIHPRVCYDKTGAVWSVWLSAWPAEEVRALGRYVPENLREVSEEDRAAIVAAYEEHCQKHEKKVNAYLKRYGLSKARFNTYWADA